MIRGRYEHWDIIMAWTLVLVDGWWCGERENWISTYDDGHTSAPTSTLGHHPSLYLHACVPARTCLATSSHNHIHSNPILTESSETNWFCLGVLPFRDWLLLYTFRSPLRCSSGLCAEGGISMRQWLLQKLRFLASHMEDSWVRV